MEFPPNFIEVDEPEDDFEDEHVDTFNSALEIEPKQREEQRLIFCHHCNRDVSSATFYRHRLLLDSPAAIHSNISSFFSSSQDSEINHLDSNDSQNEIFCDIQQDQSYDKVLHMPLFDFNSCFDQYLCDDIDDADNSAIDSDDQSASNLKTTLPDLSGKESYSISVMRIISAYIDFWILKHRFVRVSLIAMIQ
jgi:hypothetical protein